MLPLTDRLTCARMRLGYCRPIVMMRPVAKRKYRCQYSITRTPPKENGRENHLPSCRRLPPASTLRNPYAPKFPSRVRAPLADELTFRRMYETSGRMQLPSSVDLCLCACLLSFPQESLAIECHGCFII